MTAAPLGLLGSATSKVSGTTLAITNTSGATIPAGAVLVLGLVFDNHASLTAATVALSASGGGTWAQLGSTVGSGITTTAGDGVWGACFVVQTASAIANGATITTATFGSPVVAKAGLITGGSGLTATMRGTYATQATTSGSPTVSTTGLSLVAGDLVFGFCLREGGSTALPTDDADTTNGSWAASIAAGLTGGAADTNVTVSCQTKVVTATGVQTYNPTAAGTNDKVSVVFALVPAPDLVIADATHGHTADSVALTQDHQVAIANTGHGHTADSVALTQDHQLAVANTAHGQAADSVALTQDHQLAVIDAAHGHTAGLVVLTQDHQLTVADTSHGHTAESPSVTQQQLLAISDALHAHTADLVALTQDHQLLVASALHGHTADVLALVVDLVIADALHAHTADVVTLHIAHDVTVIASLGPQRWSGRLSDRQRWTARLGGAMATYQRESTDFEPVIVTLTEQGETTQLGAADVDDLELAVLRRGIRPVEDDWSVADVLSGQLGVYLTDLSPGDYGIWARVINHEPEVPLFLVGYVHIA